MERSIKLKPKETYTDINWIKSWRKIITYTELWRITKYDKLGNSFVQYTLKDWSIQRYRLSYDVIILQNERQAQIRRETRKLHGTRQNKTEQTQHVFYKYIIYTLTSIIFRIHRRGQVRAGCLSLFRWNRRLQFSIIVNLKPRLIMCNRRNLRIHLVKDDAPYLRTST